MWQASSFEFISDLGAISFTGTQMRGPLKNQSVCNRRQPNDHGKSSMTFAVTIDWAGSSQWIIFVVNFYSFSFFLFLSMSALGRVRGGKLSTESKIPDPCSGGTHL